MSALWLFGKALVYCHDLFFFLQSFEEEKLVPMVDVSIAQAGQCQYGPRSKFNTGLPTTTPAGNT